MEKISTEQFWEKMKSPAFIRTGLYSGKIDNNVYTCDVPPEKVRGFIESKVRLVQKHLGYGGRHK